MNQLGIVVLRVMNAEGHLVIYQPDERPENNGVMDVVYLPDNGRSTDSPDPIRKPDDYPNGREAAGG